MCSEADCTMVAVFCGFLSPAIFTYFVFFFNHAKKTVERSGPPRYDAWCVGDCFLSLRRIMVPSSPRFKQSKKLNP